MKMTSAHGNAPALRRGRAWEVRMKWGDRSLEAEVVDGKGRKTLSLGESAEDDFVIGNGARLHFTWSQAALEVRFSTEVTGVASLQGGAPMTLGQLLERGVVKEAGDVFTLCLSGDDALTLQIGAQVLEVKRARGRIARLSIDLVATTSLVMVLVLLALWLAATILPLQPRNLIPKTP